MNCFTNIDKSKSHNIQYYVNIDCALRTKKSFRSICLTKHYNFQMQRLATFLKRVSFFTSKLIMLDKLRGYYYAKGARTLIEEEECSRRRSNVN